MVDRWVMASPPSVPTTATAPLLPIPDAPTDFTDANGNRMTLSYCREGVIVCVATSATARQSFVLPLDGADWLLARLAIERERWLVEKERREPAQETRDPVYCGGTRCTGLYINRPCDDPKHPRVHGTTTTRPERTD